MDLTPETDHFKLLEDKVGELIEKMQTMKKERDSFVKKIEEQDIKITQLTNELNELKETRNKAKDRIASILEKIENLDV